MCREERATSNDGGHLRCRLRIRGDDLWTKDKVDIWVKPIRQGATRFDTLDWIEDRDWTRLGSAQAHGPRT